MALDFWGLDNHILQPYHGIYTRSICWRSITILRSGIEDAGEGTAVGNRLYIKSAPYKVTQRMKQQHRGEVHANWQQVGCKWVASGTAH